MTKKKKRKQRVIKARTLAEVSDDLPKRLGVRTWRAQPHLGYAGQVMDTLSRWANIDLALQRLLLPLMTAEHSLVAHMLADTGLGVIDGALKIAADERLAPDKSNLLKDIVGSIKPLKRRRNVYAHWLPTWTDLPKVRDAMLFMDPVYLAGVHGDLYKSSEPPETLDVLFPEIDPQYVIVYSEEDITIDQELASDALAALLHLREYLSEPQGAKVPERLSDLKRSLETIYIEFPPRKP